jgi:hypothetical protein
VRLVKTLGLAMVAALAAMAFIGAGSASADPFGVICHLGSPTAGECPSGSLPFTGEVLGTSSEGDTFTSSFVTVKCEGDMKGKITNAGSATTHPAGAIDQVSWKGCTNNIGCSTTTAVAEGLSWGILALANGLEGLLHVSNVKGSFTLSGGGFCAFGAIKCVYAATTVLPTLLSHTANSPAQIHANKLPLTEQAGSSGACSETGTWSALYDVKPVDATKGGLSIHLKGA